MKRSCSFFSLLTVAFVSLLSLCVLSCKKDEPTGGEDPATEEVSVSLSFVSSDMNSVTINISSEGAAELAYLLVTDGTVPSARGILTAGTQLDVPGGDVVFSDLTPEETYLLAAAAVSEAGDYSDVATLEFSTDGVNCTFELSVLAVMSELISYTVTPSVDNVAYYVDALEYAQYGSADDDTIVAAVAERVSAAASAAGMSVSEYLAENLLYGEQRGYVDELTPETEYLLVVFGMSAEDASATTPVTSLQTATLEASAELTFTMSYTNLTDSSVDLSVTPSNDNMTYVFLCQAASNYPGLTEAYAVAEAYVDVMGSYLEQGIGLYTGPMSVSGYELVKDTDYYFLAFGYTPGVGITGPCVLVSFKSERGIWAEDFTATITVNSVQTSTVNFTVTPATGYTGIYYGYVVMPKSEYSETAAYNQFYAEIEAWYDANYEEYAAWGYELDFSTAINYVSYTGTRTFTVSGLTSNTEYVIAVVAIETDGTFARVLTAEATTSEENFADATCTAELIGFYDGRATYNSGYFNNVTGFNTYLVYQGLAVYKLTASADAAESWYYLMRGDYSDSAAENSSDDYLMAQIESSSYFYQAKDCMYAFIQFAFQWDSYWPSNYHIGTSYTFLSVAKDADGAWGRFDRQYRSGFSFGDIGTVEELKSLVDELGIENIEFVQSP